MNNQSLQTWETKLSTILQDQKQGKASQISLVFSLQKRWSQWAVTTYSIPMSSLPAGFSKDQFGVEEAIKQRVLSRTPSLMSTVEPDRLSLVPMEAIRAARLLNAIGRISWYSGYGAASSPALTEVLPLLQDCLFYAGDEADPFADRLSVYPQIDDFGVDVSDDDSGMTRIVPYAVIGDSRVVLSAGNGSVITETPLWVLAENRFLLCLPSAQRTFSMLIRQEPIDVPVRDRERFMTHYFLPLAERLPLSGAAFVRQDYVDTHLPASRLYLSEEDGALVVQLKFSYGNHEFDYHSAPHTHSTRYEEESRTLWRVTHNSDYEDRQWEVLSKYSLKGNPRNGELRLRAGASPIDFLLHDIPLLLQAGYEVYGEENLARLRVNRHTPSMTFGVSSGIDWLHLNANVTFGDTKASLKEIRRALKSRTQFVRLADGTIGEIPAEWIKRYRHLFLLGEDEGETIKLPRHHALLLEETLTEAGNPLVADELFAEHLEKLRHFTAIHPHELPAALDGVLYPYQKAGYDWLHFLHDYGFGGCLADDMGLGKTLQTLAFLLSLRAAGGNRHAAAPDLVVVPRSLLFNWQREVARFAPGLKVFLYSDASRLKDFEELDQYDIVLATYGIVLRNIERLRQFRFHYTVLDEAQVVKNPLSLTSRAVRLLVSDHRLALTGTPIENSVLELWSLFAFLNPGMLGSLERFRTDFVAPVERDTDTASTEFLRRIVQPFLLRRHKEQVAPELPPRIEQLVYTDMEPAQQKFYIKTREYYRAEVLGLLDSHGKNGAQMKVLEGLLRLRQICNHPALVDAEFKGESAKMTVLVEMLETLQSENHKALVFSQFTRMLSLLRQELDARKIPYVYLDGRTRDREERVDRFQNTPEIPFFLISLKAGGVGLNLTAADYVLHVDPWWNPAVEQQATDRAHRIGQDKPVHVSRLIVRDTVEEKILELQARKKALVDQLVTSEASFFKSLTRDDVEALFA